MYWSGIITIELSIAIMISNSELRQDLVSGDWIVIAPGRALRPHDIRERRQRYRASRRGCPFENPQANSNSKPYLIYPNKHDWAVQIIENKYPVLRHQNKCGSLGRNGPYSIIPGAGHHDVIITRDHDKNFPKLNKEAANLVFQAFRDRYLMLFSDDCIAYISMFHNWGPQAGASIYHPHYQMIAVPVVPPDVNHSLLGSRRYFNQYHKCVHCVMLDWERRQKKRLIYENDGAVSLAPYVSRSPFEVRIFPKKHLPYFENTYDHDLMAISDALQHTLRTIEKKLGDPDYNFFIHTAPIKNKNQYRHYHWHIEITPKFTIRAGFELSTGIEINVVDPDDAARLLRQ